MRVPGLSDLFDRWLYRRPFEGPGAARYARAERPAFADLDARLLATSCRVAPGERVLEVGCGPATFARAAAACGAHAIALDPSRAYTRAARTDVAIVRARAEALPIADGAIDLAVCLSSIRHVRDRAAALRELRRVVGARGRLVIVELDPEADAARIARHARGLGSAPLRLAFGPLVCRTAPTAATIAAIARAAGFARIARTDDPAQPVYVLECRS